MSVKEFAGAAEKKRVDPRVKRTRELLVRAFKELLAERGHDGLTVQAIAERATVNRATFYDHFADQYELFDLVISESFREELGRRLPPSPEPSEENLRALVLVACDYLAALNTACWGTNRRFRPVIEARVQRELYELLLGWVQEPSPREGGGRRVGAEVAASAVSWAIFGAALEGSRRGTAEVSSQEVADQALSVIVEGLHL
jgi:AcrR family transcriptional regulator